MVAVRPGSYGFGATTAPVTGAVTYFQRANVDGQHRQGAVDGPAPQVITPDGPLDLSGTAIGSSAASGSVAGSAQRTVSASGTSGAAGTVEGQSRRAATVIGTSAGSGFATGDPSRRGATNGTSGSSGTVVATPPPAAYEPVNYVGVASPAPPGPKPLRRTGRVGGSSVSRGRVGGSVGRGCSLSGISGAIGDALGQSGRLSPTRVFASRSTGTVRAVRGVRAHTIGRAATRGQLTGLAAHPRQNHDDELVLLGLL